MWLASFLRSMLRPIWRRRHRGQHRLGYP